MELLGVVPGLDQAITHRVRRRLVSAFVVEVKASPGESVLYMVDDGPLDGTLIGANIRSHKLPHLLLLLTLRGLTKLRPVENRSLLLVRFSTFFKIKARVLPAHGTNCGSFCSNAWLMRILDKLWVDLLLLSLVSAGLYFFRTQVGFISYEAGITDFGFLILLYGLGFLGLAFGLLFL